MALAVSVLMSFNRHQAKVHEEMKMVAEEVEMAMLNAATNHLEEAGSLDFDEATTGKTDGGKTIAVTSEADLTAINRFGVDNASEARLVDDVDDFHSPNAPKNDTLSVAGTDLVFERVTTVQYLNTSVNPMVPFTGNERSKMKRVTTTYRSVSYPLPAPLTLTMDVACGSACKF